MRQRCASGGGVERRCEARTGPPMSDHRPGLAATTCQDRVDVSSQYSVVAWRGERLDDGDFRRTGSAHLPDQGLDVWPAEELLELLRRFPLVHEDDEAVTD